MKVQAGLQDTQNEALKVQDRPILFGTYAIREWAHMIGKTFDEALALLNKAGTEDIIKLFYCGFVYGYKKDGRDIDFSEDDLWMWLGEDTELMNRLMDIFLETYARQDVKPEKDDKKKQP